MSKHYRLKQIEAKELVEVICDRCGKTIPLPGSNEIREFKLEFTHGKRSPTLDGPEFVDSWQVEDLCDDCLGVLQRLLKENEFKITEVHQ